jgi:hypothetical protein
MDSPYYLKLKMSIQPEERYTSAYLEGVQHSFKAPRQWVRYLRLTGAENTT